MPAQGIAAGLLIANSISDLRKKEILLLPTLLVWAAGSVRILTDTGDVLQLLAALLPGLCFLGISLVSGGRVGMGDAFVICAAGPWAGADRILFSLFLALLLVPAAALLLRIRKKQVKELPFLPFLCAGYLSSFLFFGVP